MLRCRRVGSGQGVDVVLDTCRIAHALSEYLCAENQAPVARCVALVC